MVKISKGKTYYICLICFSLIFLNLKSSNYELQAAKVECSPKSNSSPAEYSREWYKDWGSPYFDYGMDIAVDTGNNIYVCGYTDTTGTNDYDMVLIKYNKSGSELWSRQWGGNDEDVAYCLVLDDSDNIYIAGYTKSAEDSNGDVCIVKFDSFGNYQSNITWGGDNYDSATGIVRDLSGNFYLCGNTQSYGDADGDSVLIKFNNSLNQIWNTTWGGSLHEESMDVEVDSEGFIYVAGHSDSMDPSSGEYDNYLLKYDPSGVLQWAEDWDASWTQRGRDLAIDSNNNIFLTGYTFGHPAGSMKGLLLKYDKNGNFQWYQTFGTSGVYGNSWWSMIILPDDDIFIGGYTSTHGVLTNGDCILLNYDTSGNLNWHTAWGNTGTEAIRGLTYDSELNIYATGGSTSVGAGAEDIITLKYEYFPLTDDPRINHTINIFTPEERIYTEPMIGYYPATHGFENTMNGVLPKDWYFVPHHGYGEAYVIEEVDEHRKVLKIDDTNEAAYPEVFQEFVPQEIGSVELYLRKETGASGFYFQLYDNNSKRAFAIKMDQNNNEKFEYGLGSDFIEFARGRYSDRTWFHFRVNFNTISDKVTIHLDGTLVLDNVDFATNIENVTRIKLGGNYLYTGIFYADAIGYSWKEGYNIGDNLHEGLLLGYTNSTNLDRVGYSLNGNSIITINGNRVFPIPENGVHSIMVSGFASNGTYVKSNLRYFTVNQPETPLPPIIPEYPIFLIISLSTIGIGSVALISITLIIIRKKTPRRASPTSIPKISLQMEQKMVNVSDLVKFCPFCGFRIKNTHRFCVNCGASLQNI